MSSFVDNTPHGSSPTAKASRDAARKAAKSAWNAAPPFPVASGPSLWSEAIAAAARAGSILGAAQALARHGVPVFPMNPNGDKTPLSEHGVYSATTDLDEIARWWRWKPEALVAVPMGRRTGLFAIDVDASPPHAHDGVAAWRALTAGSGAPPTPTRIHLTASGGQHFIYRWRTDRPIGCPVNGLPQGIECKGEGGAIVFPPSRREGKPYLVVDDRAPADAPYWLLDLIAPKQAPRPKAAPSPPKAYDSGVGSPYGLKALENGCAKLRNAGEGERDRTVGNNVPALGSLATGGEIDPAHALSALKAAGRDAVGNDSLDDKIKRAFERGMENPRRAPDRRTARPAGGKTTAAPADGKPRLKIEKHSPEKTVTDLRGLFASAGGLYDRGKIVKVVVDHERFDLADRGSGAMSRLVPPEAQGANRG
jgi:hypothetical protein